jgi:hypothetical protein
MKVTLKLGARRNHPLAISSNNGEASVSIVLVDCAVDRQVGPPQW